MTPAVDCVAPLWATGRNSDRVSLGAELARVAEVLGRPLMGWQRLVADVAMEVDDEGCPVYREVLVSVPRQCGKSVLLLCWVLHRLLAWRSLPQQALWMAQSLSDAVFMWERSFWPLVDASGLVEAEGLSLARSLSNPAVRCAVSGSGLRVAATNSVSGHGATAGLVVMDEAMAFVDDRQEQAALPAMRAVADAQLLIASTAGDVSSAFLRRKVEAGRARCESGVGGRSAFFEWGAPEDADPADESVWMSAVPALGHTIGIEQLRHEFDVMDLDEFRRAALNQWTTRQAAPPIPFELWDRACDPSAVPSGALVVAVDAVPERSSASVAVAGGGVVELVETRDGADWVVEFVSGMLARHEDVVALCGLRGGPLNAALEELESSWRSVPVRWLGTLALASACGRLHDDVVSGRIRLRSDDRLTMALASARRRTVGASWVWGRHDSTCDISALMAATMAHDTSAAGVDDSRRVPSVVRIDTDDMDSEEVQSWLRAWA